MRAIKFIGLAVMLTCFASPAYSECGTVEEIFFLYGHVYNEGLPLDFYFADIEVRGIGGSLSPVEIEFVADPSVNYKLEEFDCWEGECEYEYLSGDYFSHQEWLDDFPMGDWRLEWCGTESYVFDSTPVIPSNPVDIVDIDTGLFPKFELSFDTNDGQHIQYAFFQEDRDDWFFIDEQEWWIDDAPTQWSPRVDWLLDPGATYRVFAVIHDGNILNTTLNGEPLEVISAYGLYNYVEYEAAERFNTEVGDGSEQSPYRITRPTQLELIRTDSYYLDKHFILDNDIDMSARVFQPFTSSTSEPFTGVFDGNGKIISNLTIDATGNYSSMFGVIGDAGVVKNMGLDNVDIVSTGSFTGAIAGLSSGTIENCFVTGYISGSSYVGGIAAKLDGYGSIANSYTECQIDASGSYAGGIVAEMVADTSLNRCYSNSWVQGSGLVAAASGNAQAIDSFYNSDKTPLSAAGYGKNSIEMNMYSTYQSSGWDFTNDWQMPINQAPMLVWQQCTIFEGGDGTAENPFEIGNYKQLKAIAKNPWMLQSSFVLIRNLDLYGMDIQPIAGNWGLSFEGTFDGNFKTISNFTFNTTAHTFLASLFGIIGDDGVVKNLSMIDVAMDIPNGMMVAPIAAMCSGTIENCFVSGSVSGYSDVAGIAAVLNGQGKVINCYVDCNVFAALAASGNLAAQALDNSTIQYCYSRGTVTGGMEGGLVGTAATGATAVGSFFNSDNNSSSALGTPITTQQMQQQAEFAGANWDYNNIWQQKEYSYPAFKWQQLSVFGDYNGDTYINGLDLFAMANTWLTNEFSPYYSIYPPRQLPPTVNYELYYPMAAMWTGFEYPGTVCEDAIELIEGVSFKSYAPQYGQDMWFSFTPPEDGNYNLEIFSYTDMPYIYLHTGCGDDYISEGYRNIAFEAAEGQPVLLNTYFNQETDFEAVIYAVQPPQNTTCETAVPLILNEVAYADTEYIPGNEKNLWFEFTAPEKGLYVFENILDEWGYSEIRVYHDSCDSTYYDSYWSKFYLHLYEDEQLYIKFVNDYYYMGNDEVAVLVRSINTYENDYCGSPRPIFANTFYTGHLTPFNDLWFIFTPEQDGMYLIGFFR